MEDTIYFVKDNTTEWDYMWLQLGNHPLNDKLHGKIGSKKDPTVAYNDGECWEYMDTGLYDGKLKHCFRHRFHPKTEQREYAHVDVSKDFSIKNHCR